VKQTALKRGKPLKSFTPLRAHKGLNKVSAKQRAINKLWRGITGQKAKDLNYICQWCHLPGSRDDDFNPLDGHHIIPRRFNVHTYENCYIIHRLCHNFIKENNIDVAKQPS